MFFLFLVLCSLRELILYCFARSGAQLRPATLKDGRRPLSTEEYHRSSYKPRNLPAHGRGPPLAGVGGELHHLVPVSLPSLFNVVLILLLREIILEVEC